MAGNIFSENLIGRANSKYSKNQIYRDSVIVVVYNLFEFLEVLIWNPRKSPHKVVFDVPLTGFLKVTRVSLLMNCLVKPIFESYDR